MVGSNGCLGRCPSMFLLRELQDYDIIKANNWKISKQRYRETIIMSLLSFLKQESVIETEAE